MKIGGYSHSYPWQLLTKSRSIQLSCRLRHTFDETELQRDLDAILQKYKLKQTHAIKDHDGGWSGIGLVAANGNAFEDRLVDGVYEKTEVLKVAPYIDHIIHSFDCELKRVRILRLAPGRDIRWHSDGGECLDRGKARLHVPIVTNPKILFQISHEDQSWKAGELWYGDFAFPHRVRNASEKDRFHLVIDVVKNDKVTELFPVHIFEREADRTETRATSQFLLRWTYLKPRNVITRMSHPNANKTQ